jgi:uncharacterized membrane protein
MVLNSVNNPDRDGTADMLKGLAVIFMIQVHVMEQFATPDTSACMIGKISMFLGGPPCAPVFMAVMGYFLGFSSKPLTHYIKRGILLFLGGILLNTARSANLLVRILSGESNLDPWFFIFGADILTLAGISLMVTGFLRLVLKNKAVFYLLLAVMVAGISPVFDTMVSKGPVQSYVFAFFRGPSEWSYFPLFPWYAYVLTGYSFCLFIRRNYFARNIRLRDQFVYFVPFWILVVATIPFASGVANKLSGPGGYYHHGLLYFCWILLFMVAYLVPVKLLEEKYGNHAVSRFIKWTGKNVTLIYVIQWLIIGNIATVLYRTQDLFRVIAWTAGIATATFLTAILFLRIRQLFNKNVKNV